MTPIRLGPVLVMTPDLEAALSFYRDILGLSLARRSEDQLVFEADGASLHVFRSARPAPAAEHAADGACVLSFEVPSLEIAMGELRAKGVAFIHQAPAVNALAGLRYAAFHAPGGLIHELVERR